MLYERDGIAVNLKDYILSIVAAAIVCAVTKSLLNQKTATGRIAGLLSGVLMAITIIAPLRDITFANITDYLDGLSYEADIYVKEGQAMAENHTADIIKAQTEAYILDKANSMGLEITVEVELDESNGSVPCGAAVKGILSPYAKEVLGAYMEDNLGISKEKQRWN